MKAKILSALELIAKIVKALIYVFSFGRLCSCKEEKCECENLANKDIEE